MKKMKTYRIEESTLEMIQAIKSHYNRNGFDISDAGVIQLAVTSFMDNVPDLKKQEGEKSND